MARKPTDAASKRSEANRRWRAFLEAIDGDKRASALLRRLGCDPRWILARLDVFFGPLGDRLQRESRERGQQTIKALRKLTADYEGLIEAGTALPGAEAELERLRLALKRAPDAFAAKPLGVAWNYEPLAGLLEYLRRFGPVSEADLMRIVAAGLRAVGRWGDAGDRGADTCENIRKGLSRYLARPEGKRYLNLLAQTPTYLL